METVNTQSAVDRLKEMIQSKIANLHAESCGLTGGKGFLQIEFKQTAPHLKDGGFSLFYDVRLCGGRLMNYYYKDHIAAFPIHVKGEILCRVFLEPNPDDLVMYFDINYRDPSIDSKTLEMLVMAAKHNLQADYAQLMWLDAFVKVADHVSWIVDTCREKAKQHLPATIDGILGMASTEPSQVAAEPQPK